MNEVRGQTVEPLPLTDRQAEVMEAITRYHAAIGENCPAQHIARRLKIHHETARQFFDVLHRKGWLKTDSSPAEPLRPFFAHLRR